MGKSMRVNVHSVHKPNMTFFFQQKKKYPASFSLKGWREESERQEWIEIRM